MVFAALKSLTWGTIAAAVFSALLLAYAGSGAAHEARHEVAPAIGLAPR
jgi:methyl coenzyme M reductase subunit C